VRKFIRLYRKEVALGGTVLLVLLAIAAQHEFWTKPGVLPQNVDQSAVSANSGKTASEIVREGYVGTPTRLPVDSGFDGRVSEVYVKDGQSVKAGQPLFKLEAASVQKTGSSAAITQANDNTLRDYNSLLKLYEQGIISRRELENAKTRLEATPQTSNNGQRDPTGPVITRAPIAGVVTDLTATAGNAVQAGQQMLFLGSRQTLEVVVSLEQSELYRVQPGTSATVEVSGVILNGEVAGIFPEVKDNAVAYFLAHINLFNLPVGLLQEGMKVKVQIAVEP